MKRKLSVLLMATALSAALFTACGSEKESDNSGSKLEKSVQEQQKDVQKEEQKGEDDASVLTVKKGDIISFGTYEQDNDTSDGKEEIEWLVLDQQDDKLLVISKYILDVKKYNETGERGEEITWENSTIRKWLNEDFVQEAFNEQEQAQILVTQVKADKNPDYDTEAGNDTEDKLFLPGLDDVRNTYFTSDEERICGATDYAIAGGVVTYEKYMDGDHVAGVWWIRTPGAEAHTFVDIVYDGFVNKGGVGVLLPNIGVRPMMWIERN